MAKTYDRIDEHMAAWIARQPMFFVGTAPLAGDGHVNISPKGPGGSLRVIDPETVAYLDATGSGIETVAHLRENGRIVVMLCAFEGPPRIVRLHGRGEVVPRESEEFDSLYEALSFDSPSVPESSRAIVRVAVTRIATSCGYAVPLMSFEGDRDHLRLSAAKRLRRDGPEAFDDYRDKHNAASIDGLPALDGMPVSYESS
jgi:predicted pyridoxine 5'-phosphate oxidase superfamily flavin-nucleotide-binding protein